MPAANLDIETIRVVRGESDSQRVMEIKALSSIKAEKCDYVPSPGQWCSFSVLNRSQKAYYAYYRVRQRSGERTKGDEGYITLLIRELLSSEEGMRDLYKIIGMEKKSAFRDRVEFLNLALSLKLGLPLQYTDHISIEEKNLFLSDALLPRYHRLPGRFVESLNCQVYCGTPAEMLMDAVLHRIDDRMRKNTGKGFGD